MYKLVLYLIYFEFLVRDPIKRWNVIILSIFFFYFLSFDVSAKVSEAKHAVVYGIISRVDVRLLPDLVFFLQMQPVSPGKELLIIEFYLSAQ